MNPRCLAPALRLALHALPILLLPAAATAQTPTFRVTGSGANTYGAAPASCTYAVTQGEPELETRSCTAPSPPGGQLFWEGTAVADRGKAAAYARSICDISTTLGNEYHTVGESSAFDFMVVGPPAGAVSVTMHGTLEYSTAFSTTQGGGSAGVDLAILDFGINLQSLTGNDVVAVQGTRSVTPNVAQRFQIYVATHVLSGGVGHSEASARVEFALPKSGPIFDLPPGYTVQCPSLNIVDNEWLGPVLCPVIVQQPSSAVVPIFRPVAFSIQATGQALTYQWFKNGAPLLNNGRILGATTPTLVITSVLPADVGQYTCRVSNPCDSLSSRKAALGIVGRL